MKAKKIRKKIDSSIDILTTLSLSERESLPPLLDDLPVYLWMHDQEHRIIYANQEFNNHFINCRNKTCYQCLMGKTSVCSCCLLKKMTTKKKAQQCRLCKRGTSGYDIIIFHTPIINNAGEQFILKSSVHIQEPKLLSKTGSPK